MVTLLGSAGNFRLQVTGMAPTLLSLSVSPSTRKTLRVKPMLCWPLLRFLNRGARTLSLLCPCPSGNPTSQKGFVEIANGLSQGNVAYLRQPTPFRGLLDPDATLLKFAASRRRSPPACRGPGTTPRRRSRPSEHNQTPWRVQPSGADGGRAGSGSAASAPGLPCCLEAAGSTRQSCPAVQHRPEGRGLHPCTALVSRWAKWLRLLMGRSRRDCHP